MFSQAFQAATGAIWDRGEVAPNRPQPSDSSSSHRAIRYKISDNSIQNIPGSMEIKEIEYSDVEMDAEVDELIQHLDAMTPSLSGIGTANEGSDDDEEHYSPRDDFFTATEGPLTGEGSSTATRIVESELVSLPQDIHLVCHSQIHQYYFDLYGIVWGVQWEIARLITAYPNFHWSHVGVDGLRDLCGTNASKAPSVAKRYLAEPPELANYLKRERLIRLPDLVTPWDGYDSEEPYIRADHRSKLMNEQGGTILQRIHLHITKETPSGVSFEGLGFRFTLEQPMKSKSSRFSRYLGSRRLIECHFSKQSGRDHQEKIIKFFSSKKLLINGRLFQAFYGHSLKIHLMEINEDFGRSPDETAGDHNRMSILDFIAWHNDTELNSNQTLGKWASRFSLGFSTSLPGLMFEPDHIYFIEDEYAPGVDPSSAAAHEIMTDGCGLINLAALRAVQETMGWESFPVHVQARIAGSKGLFSLHPHHLDPNEEPKIWMRKSQVKVKLSDRKLWSRFHYVLDVCSGPFMQTPSSITYEMILCLSAGGVPDQVFIDMLRQSIQDVATDLDPSLRPHGSELLWDSIYNSHRVLQSKLKNILSPELQRAYGFVTYAEDDEVDPEETAPSKWEVGPDPASGTPASAQEQVLGWLQAGFKPTDPFVMERLVYLQKKLMESAVEKYRIIIPKSLRAHIIPDPLNVLEEGEVFFASSQTLLENSSGLKKHSILGPVIVSRNPCVQQSDARKVIAVDKYELWSRGYYDVVVFSTKGSCSLASILSGGDYDGDNVVLIWDEVIVNNFVNSDLSAARPTMEFEEENFEKSKIKLRDVVSRSQLERSDLQLQLIQALLRGAVVQNLTGRYNIFYRNSVYKNGLDHSDTIRLGHMYAQCLDLAKSGLIVKAETWRKDVREWDREPPACFAQNREEDRSHGQKRTIKRNQYPPFILDILRHVAETETEAYKSRLSRQKDQIFGQRSIDDQLIHPFNDAKERVSQHGFPHELKLIQKHVETYREYYNKARSNQGEFSPAKRHGKHRKDDISIGEQQESERAVADAYNRNLPTGMVLFDDAAVRRVAASYAYYREAKTSSTKFNYSFGVAWAELCAIKARSTGGDFVTSTSEFMNGMAIHKKVTKVFREMDL